jgi:uncharacterized membrane protein
MERHSAFTQTTQRKTLLEKLDTELRYPWIRLFFSDDVSPHHRPVADLQRRAAWIGLALLLQSLNEINHSLYFPYLASFSSLIPFVLIAGSFYAMWMAMRHGYPHKQPQDSSSYPPLWQRIILILLLLLTIAGTVEFGYAIVLSVLPPQFSNDGTSLDTNAAILLLQGRNPYTDSNMLDLARKFPIQPNWTTPLRLGQFAHRLDYPTMPEFQSVLDTDFKSGVAVEFESKVSYPDLSFLTLLPFALFKDYNVLPFYLASYLMLVAISWKITRAELRPWIVLLGLANVPMWSSTTGGNLDIFCTLLVVLAWLKRDERWWSAVLFGLAMATKQTSWFLAPFFAMMTFRQHGLKETLYRLTIAGGLCLLINLPFILWNPYAWLAGILAPVADPMFPLGVGLVGLSTTHLMPFFPSWVYSVLEGMAMVLMLAWYWRICRSCPESALLLAIIPLFFAWRSLPSYFYCAAYPIFILMAAKLPAGVLSRQAQQPQLTGCSFSSV